MTLAELRAAVTAAVQTMEEAHRAIEDADSQTADLDALEAAYNDASSQHRAAVARLERAQAVAQARAAAPVQAIPDTPEEPEQRTDVRVTREPLTYERFAPHNFFRDLARQEKDPGAAARLERHRQEMRDRMTSEQRALSSTDSAGGYLVPPLWLQDEFVTLARAGRVVANVLGSRPLPPNTDNINLPTMATGTTVANQADNAAVSSTDATFGTIAADVKTKAGMQDVSQQLVDRSIPGVQEVIFQDLIKAYNVQLDADVVNSSTTNNLGLLQVSGTNSITYTSGSPTAAGLYPKIADAIRQVQEGIFLPPTACFMHPRRWAFFEAALDANNRPLIVPSALPSFNAMGGDTSEAAQGPVGNIQGLPVYIDPNIPNNLGAGTNEDRIIICRVDELYLWEESGGPFLDTFRDVGSGTLTVRFRAFNYWAQCHARRPKAISVISGTGLQTPTF